MLRYDLCRIAGAEQCYARLTVGECDVETKRVTGHHRMGIPRYCAELLKRQWRIDYTAYLRVLGSERAAEAGASGTLLIAADDNYLDALIQQRLTERYPVPVRPYFLRKGAAEI